MKNLSKYEVKFVDADQQRHFLGWSHYCEFWEITDPKTGEAIAKVDEEDGTAMVGMSVFQRDYRNTIIPIELLEVHDKYILIKVYNKYNTVKKLYYDFESAKLKLI